MATLYMLHIERFLSGERPQDANKTAGAVDLQRRELLKRYGNWVQCQCNRSCGLEWNFANDVGLHRGDHGKQGCAILELFWKTSLETLFTSREKNGFLDKTRLLWERSEVASR